MCSGRSPSKTVACANGMPPSVAVDQPDAPAVGKALVTQARCREQHQIARSGPNPAQIRSLANLKIFGLEARGVQQLDALPLQSLIVPAALIDLFRHRLERPRQARRARPLLG